MAAADEYGPGLPPGLSPEVGEDNPSGISSRSLNDALPSYGPCLPPELVGAETNELPGTFGPALPPSVGTLATGEQGGEGNRTVQSLVNKKGVEEDEVELIGPPLPGPDQQVHGLALSTCLTR